MICRVCDSTDLELAVDLGSQPWCNHFLRADEIGAEPMYPLRVVYCRQCSTVQLDYTIKKEIMFGDHTYLSGVTRSLSDHFRKVAAEVDERFGPSGALAPALSQGERESGAEMASAGKRSKSVLDIGSNDGTQLKHFQQLGYDVLGVESSKRTAEIANQAGVPTLNEFFNLQLVRRLQRKFDVVNASGVFFHLEELHSVTDGIRECLADDGVFVVQFLYMKQIVENLAFDQIYHEHLLYYNLATIEVLLARHGLSMFDAYVSPIHGGSVIGFVTHRGRRPPTERLDRLRAAEAASRSNDLATYLEFARRIEQMKAENLGYLDEAKRLGKTVFGMGAPVKGNTLLNYFGIGKQYLDCLVEKNELRRGLFSPGQHLPIAIERELAAPPDIYYVLAWNFKQEILANNRRLIDQGVEFFFPVNPKEVCV
ncbi:MAG TPA: class I SAM-dependent methyltransferase [Pirellulales bacterium]|nr:class I SAM-dependent methyltransferase [Pirellulales bacterium]